MSLPSVPPSGSTSFSVDAERDAWLSEALRHAPDADVAPPEALSDMILREAQAQATRRPSAPVAKRPSFWTPAWLWSAQPAVGAGLASVMVASLVGVMLWDRPLEENMPRSLPEIAVAPAPVPAPTQKEAPVASTVEQLKQAPSSLTAPHPAPAVAMPPPGAEAAATASLPQTAAPAPGAQAPMAAQQRESNADVGSMQDRLAPTIVGRRSSASAEHEFDKLRAGVAAEPETWSWQRNSGQSHVVDDDLSAFLSEVDAVAASRWQRPGAELFASRASGASSLQSERGGTWAQPSVPAQIVRLMSNGRVIHTLRLNANTLRWEHDAPDTRFVTEVILDEAQAQRIRRALDKLGP